MSVTININPSEAITRVAAALKEVDAKMVSEFRQAMRKVIEPYVVEAQTKIVNMPVKRMQRAGYGTLRRAIAAGVTTQIRMSTNAGMRIQTHEPKPGAAIIPRGFDRPEGWRHPVFGHPQWVRQVPLKPGWFVDTFSSAQEPMQQALGHVLNNAAEQVARAGSPLRA